MYVCAHIIMVHDLYTAYDLSNFSRGVGPALAKDMVKIESQEVGTHFRGGEGGETFSKRASTPPSNPTLLIQ